MVQCDICQVVNDEMAQFCKECGGRLPVRPQTGVSPGGQPEQQAEPVKKPRPRLKSPILGSSEDDDDFQDDASDIGPSSTPAPRKKKGLRSPILGGADDYEEDEAEERPRPRGKGGLRSPMLGGAGDDDDFEEMPKPKQGRAKGGLRSPMLGGANDYDDDDDDDDYSEPQAPVGKGGLRSPILGGGEPPAKAKRKSPILGGGGGREPKDHIEFPHRTHSEEEEPHLNTRPKGLRSPLLGGDDGDFEEMPEPTRRKSPAGRSGEPHHQPQPHSAGRKLRSPILGGADPDDFDDFDDYQDDDDEYDDEDETALRSPLLAARSPSKKAKPNRAEQPAVPQASSPAPPVHAPGSGAVPPTQTQAPLPPAQPQFSSSPTQNPAPSASAGPMANAGQAYPPQNYQNPAASQTQLPQMPQTPPRYQPQPAPKPTNSNYRMPEQTLVQLEPLPSQASQPAFQPSLAQQSVAPESPPKQASINTNKVDTKPQEKLHSRLLASDADAAANSVTDDLDYSGSNDRRLMGDRRGTGSRRKSDSFADEEVESFSTMRQNSTGGAAGMAPVVMALVGLALIAKAWFIFSYLKQDGMLGIATIADQLTTAAALVATIMMASKINRPM